MQYTEYTIPNMQGTNVPLRASTTTLFSEKRYNETRRDINSIDLRTPLMSINSENEIELKVGDTVSSSNIPIISLKNTQTNVTGHPYRYVRNTQIEYNMYTKPSILSKYTKLKYKLSYSSLFSFNCHAINCINFIILFILCLLVIFVLNYILLSNILYNNSIYNEHNNNDNT
eukprot:518898_1